ncbi:MAG: 50S ribosomal protein L18 [Candidatus Symbiodolus clandestinus]
MNKQAARLRRATRTRCTIKRLSAVRLLVHRTPRHIYAQVIAANGTSVIATASTVEKSLKTQLGYTGNKQAAMLIGRSIAERALAKGVKQVAFDRSGFQYHGRIQSLAEAAREAGLDF